MPLGLATVSDTPGPMPSGLVSLVRRVAASGAILAVIGLGLLAGCKAKPKGGIGIDTLGGISFLLEIQPAIDDNGNPIPITKDGVAQVIRTIEQRLNTLGTKDPTIFQQGDDMIIVQMPGIEPEEVQKVREVLEKVAKLELKRVNLDGFKLGPDGRTLAERVLSGDSIAPGYKAYIHDFENDDGEKRSEVLLLSRRTVLDGSDVRHAGPNAFDPTKVDITLSGDGEDKMIALTKNMTPKLDRIAIVLDGKVMSAPIVISTPLGRQFVIEGMSGREESQELANALLNPLKYRLKLVEERTVSPELARKSTGPDSKNHSKK